MTAEQIARVRATWPAVAGHADRVTAAFYDRLFAIDRSAAALFAGTDMAAQRAKLAQALGVLVGALDDLDRLLPVLAALGRRHAGYGVEAHHFDSVGQALLAGLEAGLGDAFTEEIRDGWAAAYGVVSAVMQRAVSRVTCSAARPASPCPPAPSRPGP